MPSFSSRTLDLVLRLTRRRDRWSTADRVDRDVAARGGKPSQAAPPTRLSRHVDFQVEEVGGWPVYTAVAKTTSETRPARVVIYLHGGGWINEIVAPHWSLIARIAREASAQVVVPIYPLAPDGTASSLVPRLADLVRKTQAATAPAPVTLMGDSAGGTLALATAQELLRRHHSQPTRLILISPVVDATLSNPEIETIAPIDRMLAVDGLRHAARLYAAELPASDPRVSPINGELEGLPATELFIGTADLLLPDVRRLAARLRDQGSAVTLSEAPGGQHVYPLTPTTEGRRARSSIVDLILSA